MIDPTKKTINPVDHIGRIKLPFIRVDEAEEIPLKIDSTKLRRTESRTLSTYQQLTAVHSIFATSLPCQMT
jgi:hypothetical protein